MAVTPAEDTKRVLRQASGVLRTANPLEAGFDRLVDEALQLPRGDRAYQRGYPKAFGAGFSELAGRNLTICLEPGGPLAPPDYRIAPNNIDAEQALLGAILVNNDAYYRVSDFLEPPHFFEDLPTAFRSAVGAILQ